MNTDNIKIEEQLKDRYIKAEDFFQKNRKVLLIVGAVIVGLVGLGLAYKFAYLEPMEAEAKEELYIAQEYYAMDSVDVALNGVQGKFMGVVQVADEYGPTKAGKLASYMAGTIFMKKGEYQTAIDYLEDADFDDHTISSFATGLIGDAYVELGNLDKAVDYYMKAARKNNNNLTTPYYYKKAGLVYENLNEPADALKAYEAIKEDYEKSNEASDIDKFIHRARTASESK
jgi:tetratricopeptide (TPR) repeat protein